MSQSKKFYITTPLYYVNDVPHIGHAYSTVGADVFARYQKARGRDVFFLTGTDEHGQKIAKAAAEKGYASPKALADDMVTHFKAAWSALGIEYDRFIRTTDQDHYAAATEFFNRVKAAGLIEKRSYEGWYCVHEETFYLEKDLAQPGNLCPECERPASRTKEENYFFLQSRLAEKMRAHLDSHPDFVMPEARRNEIMGSYFNAEGGVQDISITRSAVKWGIPVPGDEQQVLYVWFDALINYLTATGWPAPGYEKMWPADVHIIGKEILRFHAVLWPAMLLAAGIEAPKKVFGTGWIINDGKKMSKSLGNVIDPIDWATRFGPEVVRYYLLRDVPFGADASVSEAGLQGRYNSELADVLGNLLSRTLALYGKTPVAALTSDQDPLLLNALSFWRDYAAAMDKLAFHEALERLFQLARAANEYIQRTEPWKMAKLTGEDDRRLLAHTLYCLLETLRMLGHGLRPFMPQTSEKLLEQLGQAKADWQGQNLESLMAFNEKSDFGRAAKGDSLFPKPELAKT